MNSWKITTCFALITSQRTIWQLYKRANKNSTHRAWKHLQLHEISDLLALLYTHEYSSYWPRVKIMTTRYIPTHVHAWRERMLSKPTGWSQFSRVYIDPLYTLPLSPFSTMIHILRRLIGFAVWYSKNELEECAPCTRALCGMNALLMDAPVRTRVCALLYDVVAPYMCVQANRGESRRNKRVMVLCVVEIFATVITRPQRASSHRNTAVCYIVNARFRLDILPAVGCLVGRQLVWWGCW